MNAETTVPPSAPPTESVFQQCQEARKRVFRASLALAGHCIELATALAELGSLEGRFYRGDDGQDDVDLSNPGG